MRNYRLSKDTVEHYTSLQDLRVGFGMKPITRKTNDKNKLKKQQEDFCSKHKCRACGSPMTYMGGNIMTCQNPNCKGIPVKHVDTEGNETTTYFTSYYTLDKRGSEIAHNIFE